MSDRIDETLSPAQVVAAGEMAKATILRLLPGLWDGRGVRVMEPLVNCPFCGESDFDLIGLKIHLESGHCEEYEGIALCAGPMGLEPVQSHQKEKP